MKEVNRKVLEDRFGRYELRDQKEIDLEGIRHSKKIDPEAFRGLTKL